MLLYEAYSLLGCLSAVTSKLYNETGNKFSTPSKILFIIISILFVYSFNTNYDKTAYSIQGNMIKFYKNYAIAIRDINKNLLIPSIDLNTGAVYFFSSINENRGYSDKIRYVNDIEIGKAVRASCSYPGVFSPCPYKETVLVDGGIREN